MKRDPWDNRRRPYHTCSCQETTWFELSGGPYICVIDSEDAATIGHWNWGADVSGRSVYATRIIRGKSIAVHRVIVAAPDDMSVDHKDGIGLNNRKANLRIATGAQNRANARRLMATNTSGFKGVSLNKREGKYKAHIARQHLGTFDTAEEAAVAYDEAAVARYGEFAATNQSLGRL